jgi:hypothetical protein
VKSGDKYPYVFAALGEGGDFYVMMALDSAKIELPGLGDASAVSFDGGIVKFDAQGTPRGLLPFEWGESTSVASFELAPGGRSVLAGGTSEPVTYLAPAAEKNVELVTSIGGRRDGSLLVLDAASGQVQSDRAYGDAFDQAINGASVNPAGAFSLHGVVAGSMQLGDVTFGDAASPGARVFVAAGSL